MIAYLTWDVRPEVFAGLPFLRWYGLCWVLGMFLGYVIMRKVYRSEALPAPEVDSLAACVAVSVILGARLGHIIFYEPVYYWNNPIEMLPFRVEPRFEFTGFAGLASHGGVVGALAALYFFGRKYGRGYLWLLDRVTIAGAALGGFIRVGNLMNSEIVGSPSGLPWAFIFTSVDQVPRHPAQLYEALFYFAVSVGLYYTWKSKPATWRDGFIFGLGLTLIFAFRFVIEFMKEAQVAFERGLPINMGQTLSIPLIVAGIVLMLWSSGIVPARRQ